MSLRFVDAHHNFADQTLFSHAHQFKRQISLHGPTFRGTLAYPLVAFWLRIVDGLILMPPLMPHRKNVDTTTTVLLTTRSRKIR